MKKLYRGAFKTKRAVYIKYTHAYTERQAWLIMCRRIAKETGVDVGLVMGHFEKPDNHEISIEMEYRAGEAT